MAALSHLFTILVSLGLLHLEGSHVQAWFFSAPCRKFQSGGESVLVMGYNSSNTANFQILSTSLDGYNLTGNVLQYNKDGHLFVNLSSIESTTWKLAHDWPLSVPQLTSGSHAVLHSTKPVVMITSADYHQMMSIDIGDLTMSRVKLDQVKINRPQPKALFQSDPVADCVALVKATKGGQGRHYRKMHLRPFTCFSGKCQYTDHSNAKVVPVPIIIPSDVHLEGGFQLPPANKRRLFTGDLIAFSNRRRMVYIFKYQAKQNHLSLAHEFSYSQFFVCLHNWISNVDLILLLIITMELIAILLVSMLLCTYKEQGKKQYKTPADYGTSTMMTAAQSPSSAVGLKRIRRSVSNSRR